MTVIEQDTMHAIQSACRKYTKEKKEIDWEQRRYEIAKDMFTATFFGGNNGGPRYWEQQNLVDKREMAACAVRYADALIEELKKKGE